MTSKNKRIFYASQSVHLQPVSTGTNGNHRTPEKYFQYGDGGNASTETSTGIGKWIYPRGLQSAGISTTFNTAPVSQLGTLQLYAQTETVPQVEVTLNKVLDGTAPLYSLCTASIDNNDHDILTAWNKDLTEITNNMVNVRFAIFSDTSTYATGTAESYTQCSGMYLSRVSYTFPVEGSATESVTLLGSNKTWGTGIHIPAILDNPDTAYDPATPSTFEQITPQTTYDLGANYVVKRQHIAFTGEGYGATTASRSADGKILKTSLANNNHIVYHASILPTGDGGIPVFNLGNTNIPDPLKVPSIQNITISADLGRENINELGYFGPFFKYTTFPIEVTSEFQVISTSGDLINANDFNRDEFSGCTTKTDYSNVSSKEIIIKVCGTTASDTLWIDLGTKNKLTSVNYAGGDTGGGNAITTYSFQTFNKLNIIPTGAYLAYKSFSDAPDDESGNGGSYGPTVQNLN